MTMIPSAQTLPKQQQQHYQQQQQYSSHTKFGIMDEEEQGGRRGWLRLSLGEATTTTSSSSHYHRNNNNMLTSGAPAAQPILLFQSPHQQLGGWPNYRDPQPVDPFQRSPPGPPHDHVIVDPPPRRPHSGIWFILKPSPNQAKEPFLPQLARNIIRIKYRLQLEVSNGLSNVVVTLFDEVAERLIKKSAIDLLRDCNHQLGELALPAEISSLKNTYHVMELKSHTYYDHGSYETFACSAIIKKVSGMKLGIVSLDVAGVNTSEGDSLSDVLPRVSGQLSLTSVDNQSLDPKDPSLTQLLLMVRRHLQRGSQIHNNSKPLAFLNAIDFTLSQLLYMGRDQDKNNKKPVSYVCKVLIQKIRPGTPWCYLACNVCKSNEGISDVGGAFWCGVCASICTSPTIRYRLEIEVNNVESSIVALFHNAEAETLLKQTALSLMPNFEIGSDFYEIPEEITNIGSTYQILEFKTNTYIDHGEYESFVCNRVITTGGPMNGSVEGLLPPHQFKAKEFPGDFRYGAASCLLPGNKKRNVIVSSEEE